MPRSVFQVLRTVLGIFTGGLVALLLVMGVEMFSSIVHPFPPGIELTHDAICRHVEKYPAWFLALVIPLWSAIAFIAVWMARRVGDLLAAGITGIALVLAVAFNLSMLPYPIWFKVGCLLLIPLLALAGAIRRKHPEATLSPDQAQGSA